MSAAAPPVAIVGMACRLPGDATTPARLWELLAAGEDAVGEIPPGRFDVDEVFDPDPATPGRMHVRRGGFIEDVDRFDAAFFGISPREARRIDPQQRLLLELAWEALEGGGHAPDRLAGRPVGVFVGVSGHDYADLAARPAARRQIDGYAAAGGALSITANRISHHLDLRGPSLAVDTACSSGLTAVHLACASLARGECELALAGAANLILAPEATITFAKAGMLAPDGRCKPFDADADGYVRSEGAGVVVLKPLDRALADGDPIDAVLLATAVNQDGRTTGISLPSAAAQEDLIRRALAAADLPAGAIGWVQAHGTGTAAGDPVEAAAIGRALGAGRPADRPCLIGSIKGSIGHVEAAAGMAGLIAAALAVGRRRVPPTANLRTPNPRIPFDYLGLRAPTALEEWPAGDGPARAGVNSFGFGGANAHAIVEEPPPAGPAAPDDGDERLAAISARDPAALRALAGDWVAMLRAPAAPPLRDLCHTAGRRRAHHPHRLAAVAASREEMAEALAAWVDGRPAGAVAEGVASPGPPRVAFVFPGMGPQWWGMCRELAAREPVVRDTLAECDALARPVAGWSLAEALAADEADSEVGTARVAHLANLGVQVALTRLWASWGVAPHAVVGHSSGEAAAAVAAGALSLEDAVALTAHRGRLQARAAGLGGMLAAEIGPDEAEEVAAGEPGLALAAVNGPASVTLSGEVAALDRVADGLRARGRTARLLGVDVPYHGPQMEPLRDDLLAALAGLRPRAPRLTLVSTVTGADLDGVPMDAGYWWRNVRRPVRFAEAIGRLAADDVALLVEVGPHPALAPAIAQVYGATGREATVLPTLRRGDAERRTMLRTLGALHVRGVPVDWGAVAPGRSARLPAYPWRRERHWADPPPDDAPAGAPARNPLLGRRLRAARPTWEAHLGDERLGLLEGHTVGGVVTFPGAAFVETALAAADEARPEAPPALEGVELLRMLTMSCRSDHVIQCALDEATGVVEVHGARRPADAGWTLHARARAVPAPPPQAPADLPAARARCPRAVDPDAVYGGAARRGVGYLGPFVALEEVRVGDGEVIARLRDPGAGDDFVVHPALLDAALQTLAVLLDAGGPDRPPAGPLLPVAIDRVAVGGPARGARWAHATGPRRAGADWAADVRLLDDDGAVVVACEGVRVRALGGRRGGALDDLLYRESWEPLPDEPDPAARPRPARLAAAVRPALARECGRLAAYDAALEPALNAMAAGYARDALAWVGDAAAAAPERRRLRERLRELALAPPRGGEPAEAVADRIAERDPHLRPLVHLVRECGERLAATLAGDEDPREFLFADGAPWEALVATYSIAAVSLVPSEAVAGIVAGALPGDGRPLRVVEVGAGTGSTTAAVLHRLGDAPVDYLVTDLSPLFLRRARERLGDRPGVRYATLDLTADPDPELRGRADVVIAANVVHAMPDLRAALRRMAAQLAPGGLLVLQELVRRSAWLDVVFGQLDGWWLFGDHDLRPDHALADLGTWERAIGEAGLEEAEALSVRADERLAPVQTVLLARAPEAAPPRPARRWLILADRGGRGRALADRLVAAGDACALVGPGDVRPASAHDWARVLADARPDGVVSLWALDAPGADNLDAAGLLDAQEVTCGGMAALVRALGDRALGEAWIVTAGAWRTGDGDGPPAVAQAPVWGFARVLRNDRPGLRCRLVDLDPADPDPDVLARMLLGAGDDEDEVALRGGRRLARRVRPAPLPPAHVRARRVDRDGGCFRLEIGRPGALETLALRPAPAPDPGSGEVAIRVRAAALNFRDVLVALGVIRWPGGGEVLLGGECAGVVEACGEGVDHLAPGDEVLALGLGSFANRVVVRAEGAVRKARNLDPIEAATAPAALATAVAALRHMARLAPGERVLVHSAAGGVGLAALQVARHAGAEIYGTAGTAEKRGYLESLGVTAALDSRSLAFADEILRLTGGEGVDVVLNSLAGEATRRGVELLRPLGRFVELGRRDIDEGGSVGLRAFGRGLQFLTLRLEVMLEHRPDRVRALLEEVVRDLEAGVLEPLPHTVRDLAEAEDAFRLMAGGRYIGRIVLALDEPGYPVAPRRDESPFRADGTYLITGGLGGLGLSLAAHMAGRGARHLVLASRRGAPRPDEEAALRALRRTGVEVRTARCDVARGGDLARLLTRVRAAMPPLRGIVHAAMALDDATVEHLDAPRLRAAIAPKAAGAWNLHALTCDDPLELFVMLSSVTAQIGTRGQAAYAAGNAALEALCDHRRAEGRPALTLALGAIADVGHAARHMDVLHRLAGAGLESLPAADAWEGMEELLRRGGGRRTLARMDWGAWASGPLATLATTVFAPVIPRGPRPPAGAADGPGGDLLARVRAAPPAERRAAVEGHLVLLAARVIDAPAERVDPSRPLTETGVDSLMAVELMTAVQRDLGASLALADLLEGASLRDLAARVLEQVAP